MASAHSLNFQNLKSKSAPFFISSFVLFYSFFTEAQSLAPAPKTTAPTNNFIALCYHDVANGSAANSYGVRKKDLIDQFELLKANYNVVGLQDLLDASEGKKNLPPKAVLITVDDGLASFYENVYPLLKTYKFKAVFAIVGKWTEDGVAPDYGIKDSIPKTAGWEHLKEMVDSGYVDIASHTYDMHQGHVFNPQGSTHAMASFFKYDATTKSYESEEAFSARVEADLKKNNELIKKHLGKDNSVIVWPYGASNALSRKAAENAGMWIQMSLRATLNNAKDLSHIGRGLVLAEMNINQFAAAMDHAFADQSPLRMIRLDLDSIWTKNEAETELNLGDMLEQSLALGANGVMLQAISESGEAYFANSSLKVRGDYLNRTAHTMRYRAGISYVYARLPESFLKNTAAATTAIRDLAKFTDIDGVFFEVSSKENLKKIPFEVFMAAGRSVRPRWEFGLIGKKPLKAALFDYVVLTAPKAEKEKASLANSDNKPAKVIVALSHDYKSESARLIPQGYANFFFDVNFKGFTPDSDFKNLFSVRQMNAQRGKAEAK